jgi:hypothetical protein
LSLQENFKDKAFAVFESKEFTFGK